MKIKVEEKQQIDNEVLNDPIIQWVTFYLADEKYGINVSHVSEVLRPTEIAPVPGAPEFVMGIINLRGTVVTVVNTRKRLGLPVKEVDDLSRIVIVELAGQVVGMLVDSVADVMNLKASSIEVAPSIGDDASSQYINGLSKQGDDLLILVDLDKLLPVNDVLVEP